MGRTMPPCGSTKGNYCTTSSEHPQTAEGSVSVGRGPLTQPSATLSPQTGEGVAFEFDRTLNFVGSK